MAVAMSMGVAMIVVVGGSVNGRQRRREHVPVRTRLGVRMHVPAVPVPDYRRAHPPERSCRWGPTCVERSE